ncbi:MAG: hypothetical protein ACOCYQ_02445 [Alkalispirochaeta sp.]
MRRKAAIPQGVFVAAVLWMTVVLPVTLVAQEETGGEEPVVLSLEEIRDLARERNLGVRRSELSVNQAVIALRGEASVLDTEFTLGSSYRRSGSDDALFASSAGISVPLGSQLSISADTSIDGEGAGEDSVSLRLRPLEPRRTTWREEESYRTALIRRDFLIREVRVQAERRALTLLIRRWERELAESVIPLEEEKYSLLRQRQEVGEVSFQDLQNQQAELLEARRRLFDTRRGYAREWNAFQRIFAPSDREYTPTPVSFDELSSRIAARMVDVDSRQQEEPATEEIALLEERVAALEHEVTTIPGWRPEIGIFGGVSVPRGDNVADPITTAGVEVMISPNQFRGDERREIQDEIDLTRLELAAARSAAILDGELSLQSIAIAEEALAAAQLQEERDRLALREGVAQFERGGRTRLEIRELELNLRRGEINTYQNAADLYVQLGTFLATF